MRVSVRQAELRDAGFVEAVLLEAAEWLEDAGMPMWREDPDIPQHESAFIHRLAVLRRYAGSALSSELLRWAVQRAESLGKRYLRLDCEESRPKLRAIYEDFGFRWHSNRQVGPYLVARYEYVVTDAAGR